MLDKFAIEDAFVELAKEILSENGFVGIKRMPRRTLFDFLAERDGELVFIEMKVRSPDAKTQTFVFRKGQLERLISLERETGNKVYILLINKFGYRLFRLKDFLERKVDLKPFRVSIHKGEKREYFEVWRFNAENLKWEGIKSKLKKRREKEKRSDHKPRFFTLTEEHKVVRRFWKRIPYDDVAKELLKGHEVFVEGITRHTAWYAAKKLSKMTGRKVRYYSGTILFPDEQLNGYSFALEETE